MMDSSRVVYADYAGAPPMPEEIIQMKLDALRKQLASPGNVLDSHEEYAATSSSRTTDADITLAAFLSQANPHSSAAARKSISKIRDRTLKWLLGTDEFTPTNNLESSPDNVASMRTPPCDTKDFSLVFTSGATDSLRKAADSLDFHEQDCLLLLTDSHTSLLGLSAIAASNQAKVLFLTLSQIVDEIEKRTTYSAQHAQYLHQSKSEHAAPKTRTNQCIAAISNANTERSSIPMLVIAISAECNLSGTRIDIGRLAFLVKTHGLLSYCPDQIVFLVDAAKYCATQCLDLQGSWTHVDICAVSFYKVFSTPTGLGGLVVRRNSAAYHKMASFLCNSTSPYFGGGNIDAAIFRPFGGCRMWLGVYPKARSMMSHPHTLPNGKHHIVKIEQLLEHGTPHFQGIAELDFGIRFMHSRGGWKQVAQHAETLSRLFEHGLQKLVHQQSSPVVRLYGERFNQNKEATLEEFLCPSSGPVTAFNVLEPDGTIVPCRKVADALMDWRPRIIVRTGCCCNPGACQRLLGVTCPQLEQFYRHGYRCSQGIEDGSLETLEDGSAAFHEGLWFVQNEAKTYGIDCDRACSFLRSAESQNAHRPFDQGGSEPGCLLTRPSQMGMVRVSFGYDSSIEHVRIILDALLTLFSHTVKGASVSRFRDNIEACWRIREIAIYPIKGCKPMVIQTHWPVRVAYGHLVGDREFAFISRNTRKLLGRKNFKALAHLSVTLGVGSDSEIVSLALKNEKANRSISLTLPRFESWQMTQDCAESRPGCNRSHDYFLKCDNPSASAELRSEFEAERLGPVSVMLGHGHAALCWILSHPKLSAFLDDWVDDDVELIQFNPYLGGSVMFQNQEPIQIVSLDSVACLNAAIDQSLVRESLGSVSPHEDTIHHEVFRSNIYVHRIRSMTSEGCPGSSLAFYERELRNTSLYHYSRDGFTCEESVKDRTEKTDRCRGILVYRSECTRCSVVNSDRADHQPYQTLCSLQSTCIRGDEADAENDHEPTSGTGEGPPVFGHLYKYFTLGDAALGINRKSLSTYINICIGDILVSSEVIVLQ